MPRGQPHNVRFELFAITLRAPDGINRSCSCTRWLNPDPDQFHPFSHSLLPSHVDFHRLFARVREKANKPSINSSFLPSIPLSNDLLSLQRELMGKGELWGVGALEGTREGWQDAEGSASDPSALK